MTTFVPPKAVIQAFLAEAVYHTGEISSGGNPSLANWVLIDRAYDEVSGYYAEAWGAQTGDSLHPYSEIMQVSRGTAFTKAAVDLPEEGSLQAAALNSHGDTDRTNEMEANLSIITTGGSSHADAVTCSPKVPSI